jgi:hypothetical protein
LPLRCRKTHSHTSTVVLDLVESAILTMKTTGACVERLDIAEKKTPPYEKSTRVVAILPPCSLQLLFSHLKF